MYFDASSYTDCNFSFSSGAYVSLIGAPMIALGDTSDVGRRTGMYMSVLATGALAGPPISGAINVATGGYHATGIYAGTFSFLYEGVTPLSMIHCG